MYKPLYKPLYKSFYGVEDETTVTPLPTDMTRYAAMFANNLKSNLTGAQLGTAFSGATLIGNDATKFGTLTPNGLPTLPAGLVVTFTRNDLMPIGTFINVLATVTREDGTAVTNNTQLFSIHDSSETVTDLSSEFSGLGSTTNANVLQGFTAAKFGTYTLGQTLTGADLIDTAWQPSTTGVTIYSMKITRVFNGTDIEVLMMLTSTGSNKVGNYKIVKITPAGT